MKQKIVTGLFTMISLAAIISLSSFYFTPSSKDLRDQPDQDPISYSSSNKQSQTRGGITLSTGFENDYYSNSQNQGNFYIEVKAEKKYEEELNHIPLNISVVIDRSGSMAGEKMQNAKKAAKHIVDQLSSEDYLSVVIYDGTIDVLQQTVQVRNKQMIKSKIESITDRGGTNLMGGAQKGYDEVKRFYKPGYINRVLLLSDGQANEGITNPAQIEQIVRRQSQQNGISISTFGLGNDYNEDLMTSMAESGSGNYYFIDHAEKIAGIFKKELNGLMEIVAQNAELTLTVPEYVNIDKVYGYKHEQVGRILKIKLHDIFSEETKGLLIRYHVTRNINSTVTFATQLNFKEVSSSETHRLALVNRCEYTNSNSVYNEHFNEWVSAQVALYQSNEQLEMAMKEVDNGNYEKARTIVKENKVYMSSKSKLVDKSPELQKAQSTNESYDLNISNVEAMPAEEKKYLQKATKSDNYMIRNKKK